MSAALVDLGTMMVASSAATGSMEQMAHHATCQSVLDWCIIRGGDDAAKTMVDCYGIEVSVERIVVKWKATLEC
jgi:hypothetical protein